MREQRYRHSNLQPYIRTADTAGNSFFVSQFGFATLKSRAIASEDILALRWAAYVCVWQVNHHERVKDDKISAWWHRFTEEHKLHVRGLGEELLRLSNGQSISTEIASLISRCHADARFSSARGNRKQLATNLSSLHGKFPVSRLPQYREAIAGRAPSLLDRAEAVFRQWGTRLREEHGLAGELCGYEVAEKAFVALSEEVERKREELTKKRGELAAKVPQTITKVADATGAWHRLIGKREAVEEAMGEALQFIGEEWQIEVTLIAVGWIEHILNGFADDEGQVVRPGLIQVTRQSKERVEQEMKRWRDREGEFARLWRTRLQMLKNRVLDFEAILDGNLLDAERLEDAFTARIAAPGVVAESLECLARFLRSNPSSQDLKDFLLDEGRRVFRDVLGGSLEEEVVANPARLREVGAVIRKSRPLGSLREDVLKRWHISRQERSLAVFTVADPDHSAIKQALLKGVEGVTEDCFVDGPSDRLIAIQEFWGLPVYALSGLAKYRDAYQACLRDPAERSLHASPYASLIPEIEEPEWGKRQRLPRERKNSRSNGSLEQLETIRKHTNGGGAL